MTAVPATHKPLVLHALVAQSLLKKQCLPVAQVLQTPPPQSTSVSTPSGRWRGHDSNILRFQAQVVVTIAVTSSGESYVQAQIEVVGRARCYRVLVISITRSIGEHSQTLG